MGRHANPDIRRAFSEFQDTDSPSKCLKVKCLHCGYVRAKNTTRQIEHLQDCQAYLNSPEAAATAGDGSNMSPEATRNVLNGTHPNPNLQIHRRGPNQKRKEAPIIPAPARPAPSQPQPSLTHHLLTSNLTLFTAATQSSFLSHAGCGSLSSGALNQWMVQDCHYTRAFLQFIGSLVGKIKLPQSTTNPQFAPALRTLDLLISALSNFRREMTFFDITAQKYNIHLNDEAPNFFTRASIDLFASASAPSASLLEGLVVLWASEHTYRQAWHYAHSFTTTVSGPPAESHIAALHNSLIPNWTSAAFHKFVDACRNLVDELANDPNISNGKEEMERCEAVFRQVCWLASRSWPEVDGMGEEDENAAATRLSLSSTAAAAANAQAEAEASDTGSFGGVIANGGSEAVAA